jgi:hypothetical protein
VIKFEYQIQNIVVAGSGGYDLQRHCFHIAAFSRKRKIFCWLRKKCRSEVRKLGEVERNNLCAGL